MKKLILLTTTLCFLTHSIFAGTITNNGNVSINVILYNNYTPPKIDGSGNATTGVKIGTSARGRINKQGFLLQGGQNMDLGQNTNSIDIAYGNGNEPIMHVDINPNNSYTVQPGPVVNSPWVITQD